MTRQEVVDLLKTLPDDAPYERLADEIEKLRFTTSVERGLEQADKGDVISHDALVAKFRRRFQA